MAFDIDALCVNNSWNSGGGPRQLVSPQREGAVNIATTSAAESLTYGGTWEIYDDLDTYQDLLVHFDTYKFTRPFEWTPPEESTALKFKFVQFSPRPRTGNHFLVDFTLERFRGV